MIKRGAALSDLVPVGICQCVISHQVWECYAPVLQELNVQPLVRITRLISIHALRKDVE